MSVTRLMPQVVLNALAPASTAAALLMLVILRPLWFEMDLFITAAVGFTFHWSLTITIITAAILIWRSICLAFTSAASTPRRRVLRLAGMIAPTVWGLLLVYVLVTESGTGLTAILPSSRLYLWYALLFLFMGPALFVPLKRSGGTGERGMRFTIRSVATACAVLGLVFLLAAGHAAFKEHRRWPAVAAFPAQHWNASWITCPGLSPLERVTPRGMRRSPENTWLCFRKTFTLNEAPRTAMARIAADTRYRLWINGTMALREGGLKRGPHPGGTYYDEFDIGPFLKKGDNVIAVLVWHFGRDGFAHASSGRAGLLFECRAGSLALKSDGTWKTTPHPACYRPGGPGPNFRLAEPNTGFDARRDPGDWTALSFNDSTWRGAVEAGTPPVRPWGPLTARPIPFFRESGLKTYRAVERVPARGAGRELLKCALPWNAQVTPYFKIRARAGLKVHIYTGNYTLGGARTVRAEYITRDGIQEYECPGWMNGHVVYYDLPVGAGLLEARYRESGYDTDMTGRFECDDSFYDRLWRKAVRTLYLNMRDNFMDSPDRERAQWWGDAVIHIAQAFYALDTRSHLLARKAILELAAWQRADGVLYSPVPAGNWHIELPLHTLASIGVYGFWNYYLSTGDRDTVARAYPHAKRYISLWRTGPDGLVVRRTGGWDWGDWGANIDREVLANAWYVLALRGLKHLAVATGHGPDTQEYDRLIASIERRFDAAFWKDGAYRSPGYRGDTDDRANALAVLAGLVPRERYEKLRSVLNEKRHASPYMEKYVLEALFAMGYAEDALARMKSRYAKMVESPLSTLWEGWEVGSIEFGGGTDNHAWSGGGLVLLSRYAAGVFPLTPGYGEFAVEPNEGPLARVRVRVPTVRGVIEVSSLAESGRYTLIVTAPRGATAVACIHAKDRNGRGLSSVSVNGTVIPVDRAWAAPRDGVRFTGADERYYRFRVPAGRWNFTALY